MSDQWQVHLQRQISQFVINPAVKARGGFADQVVERQQPDQLCDMTKIHAKKQLAFVPDVTNRP